MAYSLVQSKEQFAHNGVANVTMCLPVRPTRDNLIVSTLAVDKSAGTIATPTGYTMVQQFISGAVSTAQAYKIVTDDEGAVRWVMGNAKMTGCNVAEFSGCEHTGTLDTSVEANSTGADTTLTIGPTATLSQTDNLVIVTAACDTHGGWFDNHTVTGPTEYGISIDTVPSGEPGHYNGHERVTATTALSQVLTTTGGGDEIAGSLAVYKESGADFMVQEKFRFFDDDGALPTLTDGTVPVIETADITETASDSGSTSITASVPDYVAGDLIIGLHANDDDDTPSMPGAGCNGETIHYLPSGDTLYEAGGIFSSSGPAVAGHWFIGDSTQTTNTLTHEIAAAEGYVIHYIKVLAGEFDPANPIPSTGFDGGVSSAELPTPAWTHTRGRANARVVTFSSVDTDPIIGAATGWTIREETDIGSACGGVITRDAAATAGEAIASVDHNISSDTSQTIGFTVSAPTTLAGATALGSVDVEPATFEVDTNYFCVIRVVNRGGAVGPSTFKWQFNLNSGGWTDVAASGTAVIWSTSTNFANGADVEETMLDANRPYATGDALEAGKTHTLAAALPARTATELCLCFQCPAAQVANGDSIQLRVIEDGGTVFDTYTVDPTIIVNEAAGAHSSSSGAIQVSAVTIAGTGSHDQEGTSAAIQVPPTTIAGTGDHHHEGTSAAIQVPLVSIAGTGSQDQEGTSAAIQVSLVTLAGTGSHDHEGSSSAIAVAKITIAGEGTHGTGHEGTSGAIQVPLYTVAGTGSADHEATSGAIRVPAVTIGPDGTSQVAALGLDPGLVTNLINDLMYDLMTDIERSGTGDYIPGRAEHE